MIGGPICQATWTVKINGVTLYRHLLRLAPIFFSSLLPYFLPVPWSRPWPAPPRPHLLSVAAPSGPATSVQRPAAATAGHSPPELPWSATTTCCCCPPHQRPWSVHPLVSMQAENVMEFDSTLTGLLSRYGNHPHLSCPYSSPQTKRKVKDT